MSAPRKRTAGGQAIDERRAARYTVLPPGCVAPRGLEWPRVKLEFPVAEAYIRDIGDQVDPTKTVEPTKKRGRPAKAQPEASIRDLGGLVDPTKMDQVEPSKKRGRPAKTKPEAPPSEEDPLGFTLGRNYDVTPVQRKVKTEKQVRLPKLPPLPAESELFVPPPARRSLKDICELLLGRLGNLAVGAPFDLHVLAAPRRAASIEVDVKRLAMICSVLEAVRMVAKQGGGSVYMWRGREALAPSLARLQRLADREGLLDRLYSSCQQQEVPGPTTGEKLTTGLLTQRLLMVFLVAPDPRTLTVGVAARTIEGPNGACGGTRTRLGEIGQVLAGVGLVRRVQLRDPGQPGLRAQALQYVGPVAEP